MDIYSIFPCPVMIVVVVLINGGYANNSVDRSKSTRVGPYQSCLFQFRPTPCARVRFYCCCALLTSKRRGKEHHFFGLHYFIITQTMWN